jgi:hypothetical protein
MFFNGFSEVGAKVVILTEEGATIRSLVEYCYTDEVEVLPPTPIRMRALTELAIAANFYGTRTFMAS